MMDNTIKNQLFYDDFLLQVDIDNLSRKLNNFPASFDNSKRTDTSWHALYHLDFDHHLKGKRILELGCGDGLNAAMMSKLGAIVYANDISSVSGKIIEELNRRHNFEHPIIFLEGNFLEMHFEPESFDIVVGKGFIHHLTHDIEEEVNAKVARILKKDGIVRYVEPGENSRLLNYIRYLIPVPGRPSSLQKKKFRQWLDTEPHPERDNSFKRFHAVGNQYFKETEIHSFGMIERFHRLLPDIAFRRKFRRFAFRLEEYFPKVIRRTLARTNLIIYRFPSV